MTKHNYRNALTKSYFDCVIAFPLKAIKSERQYDEAVATIGRLSMRGGLDAGEREYVEALSRLIADYDDRRLHQLRNEKCDPIAILKFLMTEAGMSVPALGRVIGSQGIACEVLSGKRELSKNHVRKLATHFRVDSGLFL